MTGGLSATYYRDMRKLASLAALGAMLLAGTAGCDRGHLPAQTFKPAPDFTVADNTTKVHLADYRGKVVLVNFWATWCGPCTLELPSLLQFHHDHPEIAIVAISVDEDEAAYRNFIAQRHVDLITVRDPEEKVANKFSTEQWPETYLIDKNGMIRRRFVGAQDWSSPEIEKFIRTL